MGPTRSTGCRACVKRRIKCDETRPFCKKCARAGIKCDGFRPPFTFIDQTQETSARFLPREPGTEATSQALVKNSISEQTELQLPRQLGYGTDRQHIYINYFLELFFASGATDQDQLINHGWIVLCLNDQTEYPTAKLAMVSLATGFYAKRHALAHLMKDAAASYGRALLALAKDLQDPEKVWGYDCLAATMTLGIYEYVCFTNRTGWIQHTQGVAKLIEMRGPHRFETYPDRALLEMNRSSLILQSLIARKRCFLEKPVWQSSTLFGPGQQSPMLRVLDIFSALPGLAEDIQHLQSIPNPDLIKLARAQTKATAIVTQLTSLRGQISDLEPKSAIPTSVSSIAYDDQGPLFPTHLIFPSLEAANTITTLCAATICALEWQYIATTDLSWDRGADHEGMRVIPQTYAPALEICRSVDYLLGPLHHLSGAFCLLFPARMAYLAMPRQSRQAVWISRVLGRMADSSGFEMARNVLSNVPIRGRLEAA